MTPKISVIVPAFNAGEYIGEALDSILIQSFMDYEVIVVDDGSSDQTGEIVKKYQPLFNGKLKYSLQDNKGAAAARNTGIRQAQGEWIAFLDADDLWQPDKLKRQREIVQSHPEAVMIFTDMSHWVDGKSVNVSYLHERGYTHMTDTDVYEGLLHENFIFTPTVLIRKEALLALEGFNETLRIAEDYELWFRVAEKYSILFLDEPLVTRRRIKTNITHDRIRYHQDHLWLWNFLLNNHINNPKRKWLIKSQIAHNSFDLGYELSYNGLKKAARPYFIAAFKGGRYPLKSLMHLIVSYF